VVHYVGGAEIRYLATANNGAGTLQEVRRTAGNVLVVQDMSRGCNDPAVSAQVTPLI
jgi:hypothetical protein